MPLIVYLHGITGKGNDLDKLLTSEGFVQWLADGTLGDIPALVYLSDEIDLIHWLISK